MPLTLTQSATAVGVGAPASFQGVGGVEPYVYEVLTVDPGGTIDEDTGMYTAPNQFSSNPKFAYDTIQVTDDDGAVATARILVGSALVLLCEIIAVGLNLDQDRVYLWDQKINQPTDYDLFVAVCEASCRPFANVNRVVNGVEFQSINMMSRVDIDIISRGPAARDRKAEVLMAVNSVYAEQQMEANSFLIGKLPPRSQFVNLSMVDGAAIPYRYRISLNMQYSVGNNQAAPYFDTFEEPTVVVDDP